MFAKPEDFPDTLDYDAAKQRLKIGTGRLGIESQSSLSVRKRKNILI